MIHREVQDGVAILRMAHGKASALDLEFAGALRDAFDAEGDSDARAVILTGTGSIFSAGVDLLRFVDGGPAYVAEFVTGLNATIEALLGLSKPVVAAMNGHAIAGGCVLACACDLRVMAEGRGRVGVPELAVGVPFPTAAFEALRSVAPAHLLRSTVYGAQTYAAADALERGLVDEVVPSEMLSDAALGWATKLAAIPSETFRLTKTQVLAPAMARIRTAREDGTEDRIAEAWSQPEILAAVRDYVRKTLGK